MGKVAEIHEETKPRYSLQKLHDFGCIGCKAGRTRDPGGNADIKFICVRKKKQRNIIEELDRCPGRVMDWHWYWNENK